MNFRWETAANNWQKQNAGDCFHPFVSIGSRNLQIFKPNSFANSKICCLKIRFKFLTFKK